MDERMDRKRVSFDTAEAHAAKDKQYWSTASVKEELQTITYLRECLYGKEATTGRLPRFFECTKLK